LGKTNKDINASNLIWCFFEGYPLDKQNIDKIDEAIKVLAQIAIDDASATGGDARDIARANEEMTKAQYKYSKGKYNNY